jgi:hypothetical protein
MGRFVASTATNRPIGRVYGVYTGRMEGFVPIFFLLVVLKIPVLGALWLIWWASKAPEADDAAEDSGEGFNRWRPRPRPRGPHPLPDGGANGLRRGGGSPPGSRRPGFRTDHLQRDANRKAKTPAARRGAPSPR